MAKKKIALLIVALLAVDQIVKIWIKTHFALDESVTVFPNWFFIRFIENPGAAFGFELGGSYGKLILSIFRLVAIGALGYYIHHLLRKKAPTGVLVGFSLIFAGALGNVIDSAFYGLLFSESTFTAPATFLPEGGGYAGFLHGKVVDMLFFPLFRGTYPSWIPGIGGESFLFFSPIFNLADSYITIGVLYMLLFQRLPQCLQRPAAAQIAQERTLAQLHGGKARLCAKRDVLRQRAVFHHGHFIEAKLHSLALLCFSEILRGGPPPSRVPQHRAVLPRGAALSISSAIHAAPARASPHRAIFRLIIPYFPGSAKSPAGAVCISCRKNIHFRQIVRTRSNVVVCSIL